jgi:acyl-CoA synthetase (AMP-forming)/AMP-acid ligase II
MRTIAEVIRWRARRHPLREAVWFEGSSWTFGEIDQSSSELAGGLVSRLGLAPGERVAILDKNSAAYLELLFALDKAGLVAAPINWRLTPAEVRQILDDIRPGLLVVGDEFHSHAAMAGVRTLGFDDLPRGGADPRRDAEAAVVWQLATSGTTGVPKGAMLSGRAVLYSALCLALEIGEWHEGSRTLLSTPLFHIGGAGWAIAALHRGTTVVVMRQAAPEPMLDLIVGQRIATAFMVPAMLLTLTELTRAGSADFSHFKHVNYGTAPIAPDLLRRAIDLFGCRFTQCYGLTETTGPITALKHEQHVGERLLSCGRPMFGGRIRIVGPDGEDLPPGATGEIAYRGESLMSGYWQNPQATAAAIRDGWFFTGDAGSVDDDGFLFIKDRIKDMIVSGGENVYPAEIEAVLAGHPDIVECAVIGVPDPRWGEAVRAVVVPRAGAALTAAGLIAWSRDRLAGYKRPRSIDFVEALPRSATGKLLKRELRRPYWEGLGRNVN